MKLFAWVALVPVLLLVSCGDSKTTDTVSSTFKTLAEKQEFLERYVNFRRSYDELHFNLSYIDGGSGMVPGPTEWSVRIFATVPAEELEQWIEGLSVATVTDFDWISDLPREPTELSGFQWHEGDRVVVGLDRVNRNVLYWNRSL